jgi:TolB-like protein/Tfp pilus assembly protein PilF
LAVLPLENLSRDPEQEYFADGMTEALITDLAQISSLRVISRTSVMHYKGTRKTLPEIARELNVEGVVEGSVVRSGNRVRITAQLIHAPTDRHLWAQRYEQDMRDLLILQSETAHAIAGEIKAKLTPEEKARLTTTRTVNPEAHEAYLKGRYYFEKWSPEGTRKALDFFRKSIEIDPNFAPAYAGLADTYLSGSDLGLSPKEALSKARSLATKALELDPKLGEGHGSLATIKYENDWDFAGADREFKQAIQLSPSLGNAHHFYSHFLLGMGRFDESLLESQRFLELDPISPAPNLHLGFHYLVSRQYDQAIAQYLKTLQMDPNYAEAHQQLADAYLQRGRYADAIGELERARDLRGTSPSSTALLALAYAATGRKEEAQKLLAELQKQSQVSAYSVARVYAGLGDREASFAWLEKAYQEHSELVSAADISLKVDYRFDSLRSDPRFADLLRRIGFPP